MPSPQVVVADASTPVAAAAKPKVPKKTKARRRNKVVEAFFASNENENDDKMSQNLFEEVNRLTTDLQDFLITTRRELHRIPELMYQEQDTSALIQKTLKKMDISFTTGWGFNTNTDRIPGNGGHGVVVDIGTGRPPCVLLRADIDAFLEWALFGKLFQVDRFPQFPTTCTPPADRENIRLGHSNFEKEAEEACAHWEEDKEDCIFDVIATRDVNIAEEGHLVSVQ